MLFRSMPSWTISHRGLTDNKRGDRGRIIYSVLLSEMNTTWDQRKTKMKGKGVGTSSLWVCGPAGCISLRCNRLLLLWWTCRFQTWETEKHRKSRTYFDFIHLALYLLKAPHKINISNFYLNTLATCMGKNLVYVSRYGGKFYNILRQYE